MKFVRLRDLFLISILLAVLPVGLSARSTVNYDKTLTDPKSGISFHVRSLLKEFDSVVTVTPKGLKKAGKIRKVLDGMMVIGADIADLNHDGRPELYLFTSDMGSGAYGGVLAYVVTASGALVPIRYRELDENSRLLRGYRGKDEFFIVGDRLVRRFPVFREEDPECCASGGNRLIYYKLEPAGSGWELKIARVENRP